MIVDKEKEIQKEFVNQFENEKKDNYIQFLENKVNELIKSFSRVDCYKKELSESNHLMQGQINELEKENKKLKEYTND